MYIYIYIENKRVREWYVPTIFRHSEVENVGHLWSEPYIYMNIMLYVYLDINIYVYMVSNIYGYMDISYIHIYEYMDREIYEYIFHGYLEIEIYLILETLETLGVYGTPDMWTLNI